MRFRRFTYRIEGYLDPLASAEREWGRSPPGALARAQWRPPADVYEAHDAFHVRLEIAGVDPEQLTLQVVGRTLLVEGERPFRPPGTVERFHAVEICYGAFGLEIELPVEPAPEPVERRYDNGFLCLRIPKRGVR